MTIYDNKTISVPKGIIDPSSSGAVYPLSVAEGKQSGDIYDLGGAYLIWHYCGFAFIAGECGAEAYDFIYRLMTSGSRRLFLFSDDEKVSAYFNGKLDITAGKRYFYEYCSAESPAGILADGYTIKAIDRSIIGRLNGRIKPAFSWSSDDAFLSGGKGYCVMHGENAVSWAFSAAICSTQVDIGVETAEEYRGHGLASAAAGMLIKDVLADGKQPVWACHSENTASQHTALKLGFVKAGECVTFGK